MKKLIYLLTSLLFLTGLTTKVAAVENWNLSGTYVLTYTCIAGCVGDYPHTMNITVSNLEDGTFSGTGFYNTNPLYSWDVAGTVAGSTVDFVADYNNLNPSYELTATGTIAIDGTMSGTATSNTGQEFNWATTSGTATYNRRAEILTPLENEEVYGLVNFEAYLNDNDVDQILWAIRYETCAASTGTVFGNVDTKTDAADIDVSNLANQTFSYTADMTDQPLGKYCFVYNPVEDAGEVNIRLTREFHLIEEPILDPDNDGVYGDADYCPVTKEDDFIDQPANRWSWNGSEWGYISPKTKDWTEGNLDMGDLHGCSCTQILDKINEETGAELGGHYKYGCSKSILESWISGWYALGSLQVPADDPEGISTAYSSIDGKEYLISASGQWLNRNDHETYSPQNIDAEYLSEDGWATWQDGHTGLPDLPDLQVNNAFVDWGAYTNTHVYELTTAGTGLPFSFRIFDGLNGEVIPEWYDDNDGYLTVDIYQKLYQKRRGEGERSHPARFGFLEK